MPGPWVWNTPTISFVCTLGWGSDISCTLCCRLGPCRSQAGLKTGGAPVVQKGSFVYPSQIPNVLSSLATADGSPLFS